MSKGSLKIERRFTAHLDGKSPFEAVEWELRTPTITNAKGEVIFEQKDVKVPKDWSATATQIVASKYFYGKQGTPERELGVDDLIRRVADKITESGVEQGYFESGLNIDAFNDELSYLLLNQAVAFNSPVWFNVGCDRYEDAQASSWHWDPTKKDIVRENTGYKHPQGSACFIQKAVDSMEGIMQLATNEALLFKFGSGTGSNFSSLRSSLENVSGGGLASGPLSFMRGLDSFAGVIKSGGKTRRAAKMCILNSNHPDIMAFIDCKLVEEKKAQALMAAGYDGTSGPDSEAYMSIQYQNANNSVRVDDTFMEAYELGLTYDLLAVTDKRVLKSVPAREIMRKVAQATWECGDPGMQFDTTINRWHTSKNTDRIYASNPCSEYMFLDNSACNLASFNLMKFLNEDGTFDYERFIWAVEIVITAMDIIVDMSGYPTEEIARNSHDYRPLGLGYANLGSLLMALGLPYDSDAGRAYAATITAIMTGAAYTMSARLAASLSPLDSATGISKGDSGACPGWFINQYPFLEVIKMHGNAVEGIENGYIPNDLRQAARRVWKYAHQYGSINGFRNAQTTVLAPTGTIGFMMDCDTTGVEPELALVKYKRMVGGGQLKLVNPSIEKVLLNLGYNGLSVGAICKHIYETGAAEGAPGLKDEHLPIFDTAFASKAGGRTIHYMGHIKMMAETQPFLSGAISKTVNLPNDATVEDIEEAYLQSWKLGLKAVAIYRDGSKSNQVLVTSKDKKKSESGTKVMELEAEIEFLKESLQDALMDSAAIYRKNGKTTLQTAAFEAKLDDLADAGFAGARIQDLEEQVNSLTHALQTVVEDAKKTGGSVAAPPKAVRHRLPDTRTAKTHKFSIAGHDGYLTVGLYEDGQVGEIFVKMAKEGSTLSGLMDSFAVVVSIGLQYGVPPEAFIDKLAHTSFEPSGWTQNQEIGHAKSIMDYIARWIRLEFLTPKQLGLFQDQTPAENVVETAITSVTYGGSHELTPPGAVVRVPSPITSDAPACSVCGAIMTRNGSCFKCANCGGTSGCS